MSVKNSRSFCSILALSFVLATMTSPHSTAAVAQNNDSSMDSVFTEGDAKKGSTGARKSASAQPAAAPAASGDSAAASAGDDSDPAAKKGIIPIPHIRRRSASTPLISVEAFVRSPVVQGLAWPGIGPFQPVKGGDDLVDKSNNKMQVEANSQKQLTGMNLVLTGSAARDFLGLEMTCDFLLETLGIKPARIADFNVALESSKTALIKNQRVLAIRSGRYKVTLKPEGDGPDKTLTVHVESTTPTAEEPLETKSGFNISDMFKKLQVVPDPEDGKKPAEKKPPKQPTVIEAAPEVTTSVTASANASPEELKVAFKELVLKWQKIKRSAVKNRDISQLSTVLAGKALETQTKGIKWLSSQHQFYEMTPMGVEVTTVKETSKGKTYIVTATVKESSKLYAEQTNQLLRDAQDTYHVNYTVEKQGGKFVISDSSILKLGQPAPDGKQ